MKATFLHKDPGNTRLLLVFSGWSTGPEFYAGLRRDGWDLMVVHDYSDLRLDLGFLDEYYTVYLLAWSLGVYAAEITLPADRITAAFAVNGSPMPVDDRFGIPEAIYRGTAAGLDERNLKKFRRRMMPDAESFALKFGSTSDDDIDSLREALYLIASSAAKVATRTPARLPWTRAYIAADDRIFPPANVATYWEGEPETEIVRKQGAHWLPLEEILAQVIPDTEKVSQRFAKASISYDTNAIAQHSAAARLALMFAGMHPAEEGKILEIGCGTGLFTREYARSIRPAEATFVDITDCGPFGIAPRERYVKGDAEKWIEETSEHFDAILSASAIQWFADIPRFLRNCRRSLRPGGVLALSTFLPGNMGELDGLRPSPLIYPKLPMLREAMAELFEEVTVETEDIVVEFRSVREMLMHLKRTGVAGSAPGTGRSLSEMAHLRSLTYRPVYLLGRKGLVE